jgi:MFS transporter, UMF1 family
VRDRSRISHPDLFAIIVLPAAITLIIMPCFWASRSPAACERLAWYTYDWSNSAFVSSALTMFAPILYSNLFGPSFFSYYISMSVIAQCVVFISVSAFADYGSGRKMFFIGFSVIGCICTSLMATISSPSDKSSAAALLILANVCYGASFVFYNSYIPFLAASHEDVAAASDNQKSVIHLSSQLQT